MEQALAVVPSPDSMAVASAAAFMPVMGIAQAIERYNAVLKFTQEIMKSGKDFGTVPGIEKPSLLKPGAEKLCSFFGLTPRFIVVEKSEEWTGEEPFFYYWYKCQLWRGGSLIAEGDGSCNSRESKYRYRWVGEDQVPAGLDKKRLVARGGRISEFDFAIDKAETCGKYGKPAAYWQAFKDAIEAGTATRVQKKMKDGTRPAWEIDSTMYRVPNPDVADQVNTIQKMAQKRAMIAATLIACNASEYYTQDIEDMDIIDVPYTPVPHAPAPHPPAGTQAAANAVAEQKLAGMQNGKSYADVSQPQQDPAPVPVDVDGKQNVLASMKNFQGCVNALEALHAEFARRAAESEYIRVLGENKMRAANEFGTIPKAKAVVTALWDLLASLPGQDEPEAVTPEVVS